MSNQKYNIDIAKNIFTEEGCELLETKYKNCVSPLRYICKCGNMSKISLTNFKKGQRCKKCGANKHKYTYLEVNDCFLKNNCELLSTCYIGCEKKLDYICICGNKAKITFSDFKRGRRCKKCSTERAVNTNIKNHNNVLYFKTKRFKDIRKNTCLKKYGVESIFQSSRFKKKCKKTWNEKYNGKHPTQTEEVREKYKNTMKNRYGFEYAMQCPEIKRKFYKTLLTRHGVPSLAYLSNACSKESQTLFWKIYRKLIDREKDKDKIYFGELNKEFTIKYNKNYYKYDFVDSLSKKCIEYNGSNFHPRLEQNENDIGWCAFHPNKTVKEAREYEKNKYEGLEKRGYRILTVWDFELYKDFDILVKKCLDFLLL